MDKAAPSAADVETTSTERSSSSKPRGPGYTNVEDLIVARAFIAASENAISGNHQKGKVVKETMYDMYMELAKDHIANDKELLMQSSHATRINKFELIIGLTPSMPFCQKPSEYPATALPYFRRRRLFAIVPLLFPFVSFPLIGRSS